MCCPFFTRRFNISFFHTGILNNFDTLDADFSSSLSMQEFSDFFPDGLSQSVIVLFNNLDMNQDSFIYKSEVRTLIRRIEQNGTKSSVSVPSPGEMNTSTKPSQVSPVMLLQGKHHQSLPVCVCTWEQ